MLALCNDAELRKYVPLLLIILLGTCLRIHNLGEKSLWLDEAASVFDAQVLIPSLTERLLTSQGEVKWQILQSIAQEWKIHQPSHPPFYFVLQRWGMAIGRCEFILRFLAVSIGIVSFPVLYRLAKDLFNEKVGFLSTLLLATSPLHVYYSREAHVHPEHAPGARFSILCGTLFAGQGLELAHRLCDQYCYGFPERSCADLCLSTKG